MLRERTDKFNRPEAPMKNDVLLAVDVANGSPLRHVSGAVDMIEDIVDSDIDRVTVLHVREFSVARLPRSMRDQGGISGRRAVNEVVAQLRARHIHANGLIREADFGHVAPTILEVAAEFDVRCIVVGSRSRGEFPHVPVGSVTAHLLRLATLPVLIVPPTAVPPVGPMARLAAAIQ
jgi:nucleotide-binding universal stress UspA family protein